MITIGIAILLTTGFAAAKICQRLHLPSVTGYILAGLLLGPTGFSFITRETIGHNLDHFTQIALMLIAFGIGEHIEVNKLKKHSSSLLWIGVCEATGAFLVVSSAIYLTIRLSGFTVEGWGSNEYLVLCLLLGSVGIATAPAATLMVIRELKAKGPLTSTLMAIVAIDDGLAIMIFGLIVSIAHQFQGHSGDPLFVSITGSIMEIAGSLLLGALTGAILIAVLGKLKNSGELMTAGLAILLLCGETAVYLHLSPLLAGMAAGFSLVNKAERDVRVFRALNKFEPPIYVLFFTLAGTHLDFSSLRAAGIIGIIYFLATITGKISGVAIGARIGGSPPQVRRYLGFAMIPQAGVAIGLIFLLASDPILATYTSVITPVVLAGVFLSELVGPLAARFALTRAGEDYKISGDPASSSESEENGEESGASCMLDQTFRIIPWRWQHLDMPKQPQGHVIFHAIEPTTARGLARIATILASYYGALPMAVRLKGIRRNAHPLFHDEHAEVNSIGYKLVTRLVASPDIETGLVSTVYNSHAKALVLAYPIKKTVEQFREMLNNVAKHVDCPVAVIRFYGELHIERICIPLTELEELVDIFPIIEALAGVGEHRLQLLNMMSSTAEPGDVEQREQEIQDWLLEQDAGIETSIKAVPTQSRLEIINQAAGDADLVVMTAARTSGVERFLFGSLVDSVAAKVPKTLIVVYNAGKSSEDREVQSTTRK